MSSVRGGVGLAADEGVADVVRESEDERSDVSGTASELEPADVEELGLASIVCVVGIFEGGGRGWMKSA
jgi:hypothetical protein